MTTSSTDQAHGLTADETLAADLLFAELREERAGGPATGRLPQQAGSRGTPATETCCTSHRAIRDRAVVPAA